MQPSVISGVAIVDFELLTLDEAADRLKISSRFLRQQIAEGDGPGVTKIGHRTLVRTDLLQAWVERLTQSGGPPPQND